MNENNGVERWGDDLMQYVVEGNIQNELGGSQVIFRFPNGYGASVVRNMLSYGGRDGLLELAVIKWDGDDWRLCYDTPITNDVIGYLSIDGVIEILRSIRDLIAS